MKLKVKCGDLHNVGLDAVDTADDSLKIPEMECVKITATEQGEDQRCTAFTGRLNTETSYGFVASVEKPGEVLIPAKRLAAFTQYVDPGQVCTVERLEDSLKLSYGRTVTHLPILNPKVVPKSHAHFSDAQAQVSQSWLEYTLNGVSYLTPESPEPGVMSGVLFSVDRERVMVAANDKSNLAMEKLSPGDPGLEDMCGLEDVPISKWAAGRIARFISHREGNCVLYFSEKGLAVQCDGGDYIYTDRLEGKSPAYEKVMARVTKVYAVVHREDFLTSLRRSRLSDHSGYHLCKLSFKDGVCTVSAVWDGAGRCRLSDDQAASAYLEEFECDVREEVELRWRTSVMLRALQSLTTADAVEIMGSDDNIITAMRPQGCPRSMRSGTVAIKRKDE